MCAGPLFPVSHSLFVCFLMMDIYHEIKQHVSNSFRHHFSSMIFPFSPGPALECAPYFETIAEKCLMWKGEREREMNKKVVGKSLLLFKMEFKLVLFFGCSCCCYKFSFSTTPKINRIEKPLKTPMVFFSLQNDNLKDSSWIPCNFELNTIIICDTEFQHH